MFQRRWGMNVLRRPLRFPFRRAFATARPFVPPAQLNDVERPSTRTRQTGQYSNDGKREDNLKSLKQPPVSPSFYTTRAVYYDQVAQLETAIAAAGNALRRIQLLPLPSFAQASLPAAHTVWKDKEEMTTDFKAKMTLSRYRKVTKLLNELNNYYQIAETAGAMALANKIGAIVSLFESQKKDAMLARGKRKSVILDEYGRSYTLGKRKTSSARVWMIPVQQHRATTSTNVESVQGNEGRERLAEDVGSQESQAPPPSIPTAHILVNNIPLNEYFSLPADRERITKPLKVAAVLGKYNIFAITRGGGTSGQSGALAHGIAKAIVAHEPDLGTMFRRTKLTRRDPRMVERKKTGLAKARKRYTWVKR